MKHIVRNVAVVFALFAVVSRSDAAHAPDWSVEMLVGDAINLTSRTHIRSTETSGGAFGGDYETRGFEGPLHYTIRLTRWTEDRGWELELLHHKLYLRNRPQGVESLSVSHGFNIVTLGRAYALDPWRFRFGVGPVIAHPEARIGGVSYGGDYELAGAAAQGCAGVTFALTSHLSIVGEIAATFGYIDVHPKGEPDLTFSIRNPAIHARFGLGYRF